MDLNLSVPMEEEVLSPRITVIGVGGAGGNAVNNMISSNLEGVEFVIANTDAQAMRQSLCERRIQLGRNVTAGLGAGSRPDVGRAAAEESLDDIMGHLDGANMVFITAGMGGGTGTGAAPVVARAAREAGLLTVGVVTKPFQFEGIHRLRLAEQGIQELTQYVDTLIIIPNQNLFRLATEKTTFADAFKMADDVLHSGVRGVTDLMIMPGLINLDFADIRSVMTEMGKAMMGTGEAEGQDRSIAAAEAAISNPLLDDVSMQGARGVLINITGGMDMTLFEVDEAANRIREEVDPEANIIFGSTFDESLNGRMRVSVVATGIEMEAQAGQPRPVNLSVVGAGNGSPTGTARPAAQAFRPAAQAVGQSAVAARATAAPAAAQATAAATAAATAQAPAAIQVSAAMAQARPEEESLSEPEHDAYESTAYAEPQDEVAEQDGDEAYIPPEPMQVQKRAVPEAGPAMNEPRHSEQAPERAGQAGGFSLRNKASSLFTMVTGGSKPAAPRPAREAAEPRAQQPRQATRAEPSLGVPRQQPQSQQAPSQQPARQQPARPQAARPQPESRQPNLDLESQERLHTSKEDEEMLDIPAFLRRQAN
ncbi:cell division protein FtsZ [Aquibaculum arenosum]|uniref:Cell division protein FtsZ n=1 Tax=Aquibaculum arenosum TaxID=3032591 RepID=A0ABT5YR06_9PROT|nr:cell division protein FtsZ [Fodinicurvata sp. CAU 1616]MDF2097211.1 cell division protein FtsZ [Fodinicurvata sp. CAU 1616]